jgi:hypothetical protein
VPPDVFLYPPRGKEEIQQTTNIFKSGFPAFFTSKRAYAICHPAHSRRGPQDNFSCLDTRTRLLLSRPSHHTPTRRKNSVREELIRFWLGHAGKMVTDSYSKLTSDADFRRQAAEEIDLGFQLPLESPIIGPNGPKIDVGGWKNSL